ncbi:methionyl-tRNA formyltransferase [Enterobacteriaceae endosymbiont of Neohaemonia nigricornis]|uniref:methionyl-tRNA formyltransferase n=1 Tax=Enterobacteriaceae endosymbiont of Neohaemonia nigricornis TaxID=2675792 RepID=UPI00144981D8|nr:methionyl-tRNA formyltransferase [Enterobacteriaceae endosymbiont of Neohaemonia nigricornis]QJC30443.1 methionyl-tRNA formyltransferase [Enterobacteriaceae endosymbiont of Neohaemonia nigricornis]
MNIIFMGTSLFASIHLTGIIKQYKISCIITKPDTYAHRGHKLTINPVKKIALKYKIDILQPLDPNNIKFINYIKKYKCDIIIVVDYGIIISQHILNIPNIFCVNIHASLLPRWRGAAPIQRALLANDNKTGISIIKMDELLDHGDIIYQVEYKIKSYDTYGTLFNNLSKLGLQGILYILKKIYRKHKINIFKQNTKNVIPTYANKIHKSECEINWLLPAQNILCMIRAFNPYPGAYFIAYNERYKIYDAEYYDSDNNIPGMILSIQKNGIQINTINGIINIKIIQPCNKRIMDITNFLNFIKNKNIFIKGDILKHSSLCL